jgi:hypothetical protein
MSFAPFTPVEFFDASFASGSSHTCWCIRVTGATRYEPHPELQDEIPAPPECDFPINDFN